MVHDIKVSFLAMMYVLTVMMLLPFTDTSVAMVMTDVLHKNGIMVSGKLAKIVRIFVDIEHIKNRGVIYWPERIGPVIPTLWSGHDFGHEFSLKL